MEFLADYGMFLAKLATLAFMVLLVAGAITQMRKAAVDGAGELQVIKLNERNDARRDQLTGALLDKKKRKQQLKARKKEKKQRESTTTDPARLFVLDFKGDIYAKAVTQLREEISTLLAVAEPGDEVLVRLESSGGVVHGYGLAASQLHRVRKRNIRLTVAVDKVAASGGYMMACLADHILAAPFAVLGSIGVVGQVPNFHRLLDKHNIDYEMHTAGEYKRTLTLFGKNTEHGREKFVQDLEDTHQLFKTFVAEHRPQLDMERIATGEIWFGRQALEMQLVDELMTSDEYIQQAIAERPVLEVHFTPKVKLQDKLARSISLTLDTSLDNLGEKLRNSRFLS